MLRIAKMALAIAGGLALASTSVQAQDVTAAEAREIAKEAYIYGFPIVDNYRIQHAYWVDRTNPEYKGPWNQVWNSARLFTPADKAVQTANTDTLYSMVGADLRSEPLNFVLQFCPTVPSETALMERFAKIGVGAGKTFDVAKLSPEMKTAIEQGMADAWAEHAVLQKRVDAQEVSTGEFFGTREFLKNNYLYRMAGAVYGIYGNSKQEAMYPSYAVDADGQKLDGGNRYTLRFAPGQFPPANAFWSLTMYDSPAQLMVPNPLNRYVVNSPMLPQLKKDADGGLTVLIQNESPGADKESNWLPAPKGPFLVVMRLYWPKEEALDGKWKQPPLTKTQ